MMNLQSELLDIKTVKHTDPWSIIFEALLDLSATWVLKGYHYFHHH